MHRWHLWLDQNEVEFVWFDIDSDREALRKVIEWTGHESVPTLVIADDDDGIDPAMAPRPLPRGRGPRGVDRGSMLTEPNPGQVEKFLQRNGIPFGPREADASGPSLWSRLFG